MKSNQAAATIEKLTYTKDGVIFKDCSFNIKKGINLNGNNQTIMNCNFQISPTRNAEVIKLI